MTTSIGTSNLDFDSIKNSLKTFLQSQSEFQDYNFDGAALSTLLDLLAYNTHYRLLYDNLALGETFLSTASKYDSVVAAAKSLGYTPRSSSSAKASIQLLASTSSIAGSIISLPVYTPFIASVDDRKYTFYTTQIYSTSSTDNQNYLFDNVSITEGTLLTYQFPVTKGARFIIPNPNVDLTTLTVQVASSIGVDDVSTFTYADDMLDLMSTSNVYWIRPVDGGLFEIIFGNGVVGSALELGNVIYIRYMVSSLDAPNGIKQFSYAGGSILTGGQYSVVTINPAAGGSGMEDAESVRFNAPLVRATQNRTVVPSDYEALIRSKFPNVQSIRVWGGADNDPPVYGKVFICVKPTYATKLTAQEKSTILNTIVAPRNMLSIIPEIVDPDELNIELNITALYDSSKTVLSSGDIQALILQTIRNYDSTQLQRFDGVMRHSRLQTLIDASDPSIMSDTCSVRIRRKVSPMYNVSANYDLNIINPIYRSNMPMESVVSTKFYIPEDPLNAYQLDDDGAGNIRLYYTNQASVKVVRNPSIGTVDYESGRINIHNLTIVSLVGSIFEICIVPDSNDVVSAFTQIAQIDFDLLTINAIPDPTTTVGGIGTGTGFIHSSSRQ